MYNLGIFKKDDYFQDTSFNFSIKGLKDSIITFYEEESNKEYKVEYLQDKNGKIRLKLVK